MDLEAGLNPAAAADAADDDSGNEPLRPAPTLFGAALFRRFAQLPRPAVYALAAMALLGGTFDDDVFMFTGDAELDWPLIWASWGADAFLGLALAAALLNAWSVLQPESGALARLQGAEGDEAGGGAAMISAADERSFRRWRNGLACWAALMWLVGVVVVMVGSVLVGIFYFILGFGSALPTWLLSLKLAAALGAAKVDTISRNVERLDVATCSQEEWEVQVRQPAIKLSHEVLPALTEWGAGIGALFVGMFGAWLCNIPYEIGTGDYGRLIGTAVFWLPWPLLVAVWPAGVSSRCNALLEQLNELRCLGDGSAHERVFPLETYLNTVNKGQGIGFKIGSAVVDRRALKQLALAMGGSLSTGLTIMASIAAPAEEAAVHEEVCGLNLGQQAYLQATAALFNASCTYRAEFGPAGVKLL
eukprot:COSAG06_NODE_134_length_22423_cov_17.315445_8_plen_418_part_00